MSLKPGVINKDGALLSPEQTKRLRVAITGLHPDYSVAGCFLPHNAFVFYNAEKRPVAFVEVCFDCGGIRALLKGAAIWVDMLGLGAIFDELKLPLGGYPNLASFKQHFLLK